MPKLALAVVALLAGACARPQDARIEVAVSDPMLTPEMKVELLADGAPARFLRWEEHSGVKDRVYEVHAAVTGKTKKIPALTLKALFGCGWRERPLTLGQDWPAEQLLAENARGGAARHDSRLDTPFAGTLASVWVDNRARAAGELSLGGLKFPVAAGRTARFDAATCDGIMPVAFDGKPMGEIPAAPKDGGDLPTVLVDPSGKRCYDRFDVWYGEAFSGGGGRSKAERLSGKNLYYSPEFIAYVFEDPPSSRMAPRGETPSYKVILDAKCR